MEREGGREEEVHEIGILKEHVLEMDGEIVARCPVALPNRLKAGRPYGVMFVLSSSSIWHVDVVAVIVTIVSLLPAQVLSMTSDLCPFICEVLAARLVARWQNLLSRPEKKTDPFPCTLVQVMDGQISESNLFISGNGKD